MFLRYHNPELASRVEKMPFLETRDLRDALAIRSLAYTSSHDPEAAAQQLAHHELRDGIKDQHTTMVALLHADFMFRQGLADKILDASTLRTATEKVILPLGGETRITVARLESEPNAGILQTAEEILAGMEQYLDAPLKVRHVIIMLGAPTPGNSGGANTQTSITLPARFQGDRERLLHELAHYFWNYNQPWIDEGMAELFSQMADREFTEEPVPLASPRLPEFDQRPGTGKISTVHLRRRRKVLQPATEKHGAPTLPTGSTKTPEGSLEDGKTPGPG